MRLTSCIHTVPMEIKETFLYIMMFLVKLAQLDPDPRAHPFFTNKSLGNLIFPVMSCDFSLCMKSDLKILDFENLVPRKLSYHNC